MHILLDVMKLTLGFSISGATASAFEAFVDKRASFRLLRTGGALAVAAVPVVTLGAPYILTRNLLCGAKRSERTAAGVLVGTMLSGVWSLVIGAAALSAFALNA